MNIRLKRATFAVSALSILSFPSALPIASSQSQLPTPNALNATPYHPIAQSSNQAIQWESSLKSAIARARREYKPILHLQLFGKLTDALC